MSLSKWLKIVGFLLNIFASLYLIHGIFKRRDKPEFKKLLMDKDYRKMHSDKYSKTFIDELFYLPKDALITSALVIIGSSLQTLGDLLDP